MYVHPTHSLTHHITDHLSTPPYPLTHKQTNSQREKPVHTEGLPHSVFRTAYSVLRKIPTVHHPRTPQPITHAPPRLPSVSLAVILTLLSLARDTTPVFFVHKVPYLLGSGYLPQPSVEPSYTILESWTKSNQADLTKSQPVFEPGNISKSPKVKYLQSSLSQPSIRT